MLADTSSLYTAYTLQNFLNDPYISEVFKQTQNKYNNLKDEEQLFSEAFARYSAFFPDKKAPQILSMISAYAYSVVCADHTLAISLEMYMGSEHDAYGKIGIPLYKRRTMDRPYIVPEALYAWLASEFEKEDDNRNLLSMMIFKGKVWYALEQILPGISDTLLSGFTETQQKWCTDNEKKIWSFFIDKKLLFVSLKGDVVKYVNEAPFTAGMPRESPGRTAVWTGYRIVKKYMAEEKNVSIQQLFNLNNAELILKKSKYKP